MVFACYRSLYCREVAPINLTNSGRIESLLRAGRLYLSLQDAVALALENNLDIELQRYGPESPRPICFGLRRAVSHEVFLPEFRKDRLRLRPCQPEAAQAPALREQADRPAGLGVPEQTEPPSYLPEPRYPR